jgi:NADH-quinone oxidoreductase subunit A
MQRGRCAEKVWTMSEAVVGYIPILLFFCLAAALGATMIVLGIFVRPSNPNPVKKIPYECGNIPTGDARGQVRSRYYLFAMLLVLFDVEVVFLFPWAVNLRALGLFGFIEMMIFLGVLLLGYVYLWRNRGLEWD